MTRDEVTSFLQEVFPQAMKSARVEALGDGSAILRLPVAESHLRPGRTVSGPTLMTLADLAFYVLLLGSIGPVALAVTTHLSIDFLRKPRSGADLLAEAEMLKLGSRLAVGRVTLRSDGEPLPVAHASLTYSIPPKDKRPG